MWECRPTVGLRTIDTSGYSFDLYTSVTIGPQPDNVDHTTISDSSQQFHFK